MSTETKTNHGKVANITQDNNSRSDRNRQASEDYAESDQTEQYQFDQDRSITQFGGGDNQDTGSDDSSQGTYHRLVQDDETVGGWLRATAQSAN